MQEMIDLSKTNEELPVYPLHVQILSHPYMGAISLRGSPAQFGPAFEDVKGVS